MQNLIEKFYTAFNQTDANEMVKCYHSEIVFNDPAFGTLKGERAGKMWKMLCDSQKGQDFKVEFTNVNYDNQKGSAHWDAYYTFSVTGRRVHNKVRAEFEFKDGLIIKHTDHFDLHKWSKQALGIIGHLIGGTTFFKSNLQARTNKMLDKYIRQMR